MKKRYIAMFLIIGVGLLFLASSTFTGCGAAGRTIAAAVSQCPPDAAYCAVPESESPLEFPGGVSAAAGELHVLGMIPTATTISLIPAGTNAGAQNIAVPAGAWVVRELSGGK